MVYASPEGGYLPRFSVVIPTRNRAAAVDRCLTALAEQDVTPADFEVIVVDDGSEISLEEIAARHSGLLNLRYLRQAPHSPARARNWGLREASGDYVIFLDDDCIPQSGWLRAFDHAFLRAPEAGLGGRIDNAPENTIFGRASQALISFLYGYFSENPDAVPFFCSNNLAFPRLKLLGLSGFDESFPFAAGEDRELCARWREAGELRLAGDAVVLHRQALSFTGFLAQHFRYGIGAATFWEKRHNHTGGGAKLMPLRFYRQMLAYPFRREERKFTVAALILLSQAANASGYFSARFWPRLLAKKESNAPLAAAEDVHREV